MPWIHSAEALRVPPYHPRASPVAGAELLLHPTAIGWERRDSAGEQARQRDAWRTVHRAHAIANVLPLAACNRTVFEPHPSAAGEGIDFWGRSFVCGSQGEILAEAPNREPAVLLADVDLSRAEELRGIWPFLRDRRIDAYEGLLERYLD